MLSTKKTISLILCLIALTLIAGFSGCSGGAGAPSSIQVTITGIDVTNMPDFSKKNMAGFTISLIPDDTTPVSVNPHVPYYAMRTVLDGPVAEAVRPFIGNPPSTPTFSLTFTVELSAKFTGTGKFFVVLGASNDYCKYNNQNQNPGNYGDGTLYPEGKMFITFDTGNPSDKGTRDISDGVTIPWSDFNKGTGNLGYSADDLVLYFF